jgi:hypothetical protein
VYTGTCTAACRTLRALIVNYSTPHTNQPPPTTTMADTTAAFFANKKKKKKAFKGFNANLVDVASVTQTVHV